MKLHIRSGRLVDPALGTDAVADLFTADGVIVATGAPPAGFVADRVIDAARHVVCPGLVDLSVRLREPQMATESGPTNSMATAIPNGMVRRDI